MFARSLLVASSIGLHIITIGGIRVEKPFESQSWLVVGNNNCHNFHSSQMTAGSHKRNLLPRAVKIPSIKRANPSIVFDTQLTLTDHTVPVSLAIHFSLFIIFQTVIFFSWKKKFFSMIVKVYYSA